MFQENDFVGVFIVIYNKEAWPFTEKQIEFVENVCFSGSHCH